MIDRIRRFILKVAHLPPQPEPPAGAPGSIKIFRAANNYYKLRLVRWGVTQIGAVLGIMVSLWFIGRLEHDVRAIQQTNVAPRQIETTASTEPAQNAEPKTRKAKKPKNNLAYHLANWPDWTMGLIKLAEYAAITVFIFQIPVTLMAVRLEYEQHWYIVTDRSLRIRTGLFSLQESTMSFANLQQVEVKQGPLQRLLGIADVHVRSAGGGGAEAGGKHAHDSMHEAIFSGVNNAHDLRDLMLARLRKFREAGLGDPDDSHDAETADDVVVAAHELLTEVRALRQTLRA